MTGTGMLSIIVAVYNVEDYLPQCIESLLNQTYKNLEIILVDDGSSDHSGEICDKYAAKDARIVVIHQKNAGVSAARNVALRICRGDYITIVDSDDYVLPEAFEISIDNITKYNLDSFNFGSFRSGDGYGGSGNVSLNLEENHDVRLAGTLANEGAFAWGAVVKKKIWAGIYYPEGRVFEDSVVAPFLIDRIWRCGHIDKELYYYRKTPNSICDTSVFKPRVRYDYVLACEDRLAFAEQRNMCVAEARSALLKAIMSYFTSYYGMGEHDDECYYRAKSLLLEHRKKDYNVNLLNGKYKAYLWCCDRLDFVHIIGAKISVLSKIIKNRLR